MANWGTSVNYVVPQEPRTLEIMDGGGRRAWSGPGRRRRLRAAA